MWRTVVPELAVSHELLMHGLLAISALHYAHTHPDERKSYILVSNYHQDRALDFFSTMLTDINDHTCEAFFILAIFVFLLAAWSVANPQDQVEPHGLGAITQSFALIQGIKDIIEYPTGKKWSEGPLSPLFEQWETPHIDPSLPFAKRLDKLSTLVQTISDESHHLCRAGLESLRKAYALHLSTHSGRHRMWMWPVELGKQRFDFTNCQHPIALVILAHCAALVNCSEGPSWLWDGWGKSVVHIAKRELSQEWQEWLQWPLRCIHDNLDVDAC
ncbi:conserved hypothetical protein [Talaromyces stipitatus ATCC 10500]|uniref:C6 finger domain protein n=1 Tax=Talaromyces stipitatus (strain ATCC 10500 / CBS 375.48 / QM 6759 / NRRL 1006) TaxID=441959 RepID=B8M5C7_TALSN|nr:uncharacterized protein TSTA_030030 [Talaromyces stipitatus ATCC 10500]EED19733.1 conserved hypothetical protein [Talaromyces stipitatus ATCC 10500]